jgi:hypothetical protein
LAVLPVGQNQVFLIVKQFEGHSAFGAMSNVYVVVYKIQGIDSTLEELSLLVCSQSQLLVRLFY